jgi:hypothetical protein
MAWIVRVVLLVLVAAAPAACGDAGSEAERPPSGAWERLPEPPLSPRESALAVGIEGEVLLIGGSDADPCPPNAGCVAATDPPLRDGAAFDRGRRTWRPIAPAPVGFSFAEGVVVGGAAYVLTNGEQGRPDTPSAFLRYRSADDEWEGLPFPPGRGDRSIVATDEQVVAFAGSDERGEAPDLVFDPATGDWSELPDDPLPRSFSRTMAWSGRELVLFAHELVPQPGSGEPTLVIAAALDLERGTWRRLPDSEILGGGARWFELDGRLILPALDSADGGEVGNWGRPFPNGGVLDPGLGKWSDLPQPPAEVDPEAGEAFAAGIVADRRADYFGQRGWILDAIAHEWVEIPPLDEAEPPITGRSVAAAGTDMLVFGGVRWGDGGMRGDLLKDAWIWSPRR